MQSSTLTWARPAYRFQPGHALWLNTQKNGWGNMKKPWFSIQVKYQEWEYQDAFNCFSKQTHKPCFAKVRPLTFSFLMVPFLQVPCRATLQPVYLPQTTQVPKHQLCASVHLHMHAHELKTKAKACDVVLSIQICSTGICIPRFVEIDLHPRVGARVDVQGQFTVPRWKRRWGLNLNVQTAGVHLRETAAFLRSVGLTACSTKVLLCIFFAKRSEVSGGWHFEHSLTPCLEIDHIWTLWTYSAFQLLGSRRPSILVCLVVFPFKKRTFRKNTAPG